MTEAASLALDEDLACLWTPGAAEALETFGLALALESYDAQDLAPVKREGHVLHDSGAKPANLDRGGGLDCSHSVVGHGSLRDDHRRGLRAQHQGDDLFLSACRQVDDAHRGAVAKDCSPVAQGLHLCHPVRDQHDRAALRAPAPRDAENPLAEVGRQCGGDLVKDEEARQRGERLRKIKEVQGRRGQVARNFTQVDIHQLQLFKPGPDGWHRRPGEAQVLFDGEERNQAHVLVDRRKTGLPCGGRRGEPDFATLEQDYARVRSDVAREHLDEGAFTGAVGSHQGVYLAGLHAEVA